MGRVTIDPMMRLTNGSRTLSAGLTLTALGVAACALQRRVDDLVLLPGLMLCVSAAAISASSAQPQSSEPSQLARGSRRGSIIAVGFLGGMFFLPLAVIGALIAVGVDPLGLLLAAVWLFSLAGVLVTTFLVVFFINLIRTRRSAKPPSVASHSERPV